MAGGEVSINGVINRKSIDDQSYTEQRGVMLRKGYTENIEAISRSVKEMQFNTNQSEESALAESLVVSYEKMQQLRESISIHQQNVDRYESSIDQSQSHILNTSDDRKNQIPTGLLGSIGEIESNLKQNALHHVGHGYQFKTKIAAYNKIKDLLAIKETNFDIGCMQINYHWYKDSFKSVDEMLDPDKNVGYGANLLTKLWLQSGSWHEAVKLYHSRNPNYNAPYARKVTLVWLYSD